MDVRADALELIEEQAGNDFDPHLAKLFIEISPEIVRMFQHPEVFHGGVPGEPPRSKEAPQLSPYGDEPHQEGAH